MPTRVYATAHFVRFAKKARIADGVLVDAIERAERGLVDADLGGGVVKLRIARPNEGRSGGYRTLVALVVDRRGFFLLGYAKNDLENIGDVAERNLRRDAQALQSLTEDELATLVQGGAVREIER